MVDVHGSDFANRGRAQTASLPPDPAARLHRGYAAPANRRAAAGDIRLTPYPYRAMLAICSDLDETPDRQTYREIARFFNTEQDTAIGRGVGLEVGNSIYFNMPAWQFAYWNTDDAGRAMVRTLIHSGHIDCLHSYGDLADSRDQAAAALDELVHHDCRLTVWVDHAVAPTNFGADIMHGHGDEPGHPAYHADLTLAYGIGYVSRGRATSVLGQDVRPRVWEVLRAAHPLATGRTLAKEQVKRILGRLGHRKYDIHVLNEVLRPIRLRDGSPCWEFLRCNPCWLGVGECASGRQIGQVLTAELVDRLAQRGGLCVLYTHLGKHQPAGQPIPFDEPAVQGLRRVQQAQQAGHILTTTTRRLLGFARARREVAYRWVAQRGEYRLEITSAGTGASPLAASDLDGLTFYTDHDRTTVTVDGREVAGVIHNGPDETGRRSVSLPWHRLEFPQL